VDMDTTNAESFNLDGAWPCHKCETIQEYLERAYEKEEQAGHRHAFRGASRRYGNLRPAFDRRPKKDDPTQIETDLLENFVLRSWAHLTPAERKRCWKPEKRRGSNRNLGAVVVAQHRGIPTRGLDWSDNPLVALFFACEGNSTSEGEVWWYNNFEFEVYVGAQWPLLFAKHGHVELEIGKDFH